MGKGKKGAQSKRQTISKRQSVRDPFWLFVAMGVVCIGAVVRHGFSFWPDEMPSGRFAMAFALVFLLGLLLAKIWVKKEKETSGFWWKSTGLVALVALQLCIAFNQMGDGSVGELRRVTKFSVSHWGSRAGTLCRYRVKTSGGEVFRVTQSQCAGEGWLRSDREAWVRIHPGDYGLRWASALEF